MQNIICGFFDLIGSFLDSLLPNMSSNGFSQITDALTFFVSLISGADYLFPVSTLFQVIGIVMSYKVFMFSTWIANKVITLIRG